MLYISILLPFAIASSVFGAPSVDNLPDPVRLQAPAPPSTPVGTVSWTLPGSDAELAQSGLPVGRKVDGSFLGFSIELSVVDQILDKDYLLNYFRNIQGRAGRGPKVRIGGNSAEASTYYPDGLAGSDSGGLIGKDNSRTKTPLIHFDDRLFDTMKGITNKVGTEWFLGVSFAKADDLANTGLVMAAAQKTLGDLLSGFQIGNEPDLYNGSAARREGKYPIELYETELEAALKSIDRIGGSALTVEDKLKYLIPTTCCQWSPEDVLRAGLIDKFAPQMEALSWAHYPEHNCDKGDGKTAEQIQALFPTYLTHQSVTDYVTPYVATADKATELGLGVHMLEFNSASCSGFQGLSTSFGAAIWATDLALSLAAHKFTMALLHVGGRDKPWYNPFTAPYGGKQNKNKGWATGSVYYSTLVVAEALGSSNESQVVDLTGGRLNDAKNEFTHAYAIYESGVATRVVLFNYISDSADSNANTYTAHLSGVKVSTIYVRYLRADSVSEQSASLITWAGQSLGGIYTPTGVLAGRVETVSIACNSADGTCEVPVYAPSVAVVYLSQEALDRSTPEALAEGAGVVAASGTAGVMSAHQTGTKTKGAGRATASASSSAVIAAAISSAFQRASVSLVVSGGAVLAAAILGGGALARLI